MLGYIGLGFLILAYILLNTKHFSWFLAVDLIASLILTVHAAFLHDIPFICVNGIVSFSLGLKLWKEHGKSL